MREALAEQDDDVTTTTSTDLPRTEPAPFRRAAGLWWDVVVSSEREVLTYELFGTATRELAQEVADSGFEPDMILSIARGGLALGMGWATPWRVKNLSVINVEFYTGVDQRLDVPIMLPPTPARGGPVRASRCSSPTTWPTPGAPSSSCTSSARAPSPRPAPW